MGSVEWASGSLALCGGCLCVLIGIPWAISSFILTSNGIRTWARVIDGDGESYMYIEFEDGEGILHQVHMCESGGIPESYIEIIYNRYNPAEARKASSTGLSTPLFLIGFGLFWCLTGLLILCGIVPVV